MRNRLFFCLIGLCWLLSGNSWVFAAGEDVLAPRRRGSEESLFLDLSKVKLGPISSTEEKRGYLTTIQLEKDKIQNRMLRSVYENAYDMYRDGDFEGAQDLSSKILSIDPSFDDASLLLQASRQLKGSAKPILTERGMIQDRFQEGLALYRQGRLVEASHKWEEVLKLSPTNLKDRYWYQRVNRELADQHYERGKKAYEQGNLREALDQWYNALLLHPRYIGLVASIGKVEAQLREQQANERFSQALTLYGQGKPEEAISMLEKVLELLPGDAKAKRLLSEVRYGIASRYDNEGRALYQSRQYTEAIGKWQMAQKYGYDPQTVALLISRAQEQMRRESQARRQMRQQAQRRAHERQAEEEARKEAEERQAAAQAAGGEPATPQSNIITEENRRAAQQHYLNGVVHFQNGDLQKAREEWALAKQLDPNNADADAGLKRVEQMVSGGP